LKPLLLGAEQNGYAVEGFTPTSRAAQQLREAGISAETLQGFLARGGQQQVAEDLTRRHLYMVHESSLASTKQMREFLHRIASGRTTRCCSSATPASTRASTPESLRAAATSWNAHRAA